MEYITISFIIIGFVIILFIAQRADKKRRIKLIEKLASIEHDQWMSWSKNIASTEKISKSRLERWNDLWIPYSQLFDVDKESDRAWAKKSLEIMEKRR